MHSYEEEQRDPETFSRALEDESMMRDIQLYLEKRNEIKKPLYLEKRNEKKKGQGSSSNFNIPDYPEEAEQMILKLRQVVNRYQAPEEDPHRSGDETGVDQSSSGESEPSTETHATPSGYLPNESNAEEAEGNHP